MYVRVWEYQVIDHAVADFVVAYGADGDWAQLFSRVRDTSGRSCMRTLGPRPSSSRSTHGAASQTGVPFWMSGEHRTEALDYRLGSMTTLQRALVEATR
jgi:hypothetical protein